MRIAYITHKFFPPSETFVRDLACGLSASGNEVHLICDRLSKEGRATEGPKLHPCAFRFVRRMLKISGATAGLRDAADHALATFLLSRQLAKIRPDVVYAEFGTNAAIAIDAVRKHSLPLVIHFHGADATKAMRCQFYRRHVASACAYASAIVVPSAHLRRLLIIAGADGSKIQVVPCGANLALCPSPDWERKLAGPPRIISIGRLVGKKNPIALIEAFNIVHKQMPQARLTMVGDGALTNDVRRCVERHGLQDAVLMTGALPHSAALEQMAGAWLLAQHSVTSIDGDQEGLPVSILEAGACGLPVVSTLHSGIPEAVDEGENGYLVREHDFESMAQRMLQLLQNPDQARKMGAKGRERALKDYDQNTRFERIEAILLKAAKDVTTNTP